ncbi:MAG: hypothetical protein JSV61_14250 [Anaerolineales bacterium]|nr:MAG: hypothetical protein JSV61_14250 [Anaerolineales bacterium]
MEPNLLKTVVAQIHRRYPEFANSQPKVRMQKAPQSKSGSLEPNYLLTFHSKASAGSDPKIKALPRWMRVVVNQKGKIVKVTTSR